MYKTCKTSMIFVFLRVSLYKLVLICKFIDNNRRAKRFAQRTEEEIGASYSYPRQFTLRQVGMQ